MDGFEDVAVDREYARLTLLMQKCPDFFVQKEIGKCASFASMEEYVICLCCNLREFPEQKKEILAKMQETVNLNKTKFRVDRQQTVGMALGTVASFVEHHLLLSFFGGVKKSKCKKMFICTELENQELCSFYADNMDPQNDLFSCEFFKAKTRECLCANAITDAQ